MRRLYVILVLALAGCLGHLPPSSTKHLAIHWAANYEVAQAEALRTNRPILACLVAGEIAGFC